MGSMLWLEQPPAWYEYSVWSGKPDSFSLIALAFGVSQQPQRVLACTETVLAAQALLVHGYILACDSCKLVQEHSIAHRTGWCAVILLSPCRLGPGLISLVLSVLFIPDDDFEDGMHVYD